MNILGIDPGMSGGMVLLDEGGKIMNKYAISKVGKFIDMIRIKNEMRQLKYDADHTFLELVSARPGQGVSGMFKFGQVYGFLLGMLCDNEMPYTIVTPPKWMSVIHTGISRNLEPKKRSVICAQQLFPKEDLRATENCRVPHLGIVDALLIAEYGRRTRTSHLGEIKS